MVTANSKDGDVRTTISNGRVSAIADLPVEKGGEGKGFGAHELIEAGLAACISMTVQMAAAKHGIPLRSASCKVRIDRSLPKAIGLVYQLELVGDLTEEQRFTIHAAAADCPVNRTLSGKLTVWEEDSEQQGT